MGVDLKQFSLFSSFFLKFILLVLYHLIFKGYKSVDWNSYVTQIEQVIDGERDYSQIKGENGFLVYPAGHVYHFLLVYLFSFKGIVILGQFIYAFLYILLNFLVFNIYDEVLPEKSRWIKIFLALSKPMLKIVTDRLFNDIFAMVYLYGAVLLLLKTQKHSFFLSTLCYSVALSTKFNVMLFLPGFLYIFAKTKGALFMLCQLFFIVFFQILAGLPFILHYPQSYFQKAYDFSREFRYSETINWQMIPESIFRDPIFHKGLLIVHLLLLLGFLIFKWEKPTSIQNFIVKMRLDYWTINGNTRFLDNNFMCRVMFICNLIGISCARSLHYQFLVWYYSTIPFLVWQTKLPTFIKVVYLLSFGYGWTYQRTPFKSCFLFGFHVSLLILLAFYDKKVEKDKEKLEGHDIK